ncbi:MAG TPA: SDR family oxidoreductase [Egibacteraceae bacterium]|nr:SDR family oxidoreductase [Egibacteraceae bacterium]
MAAGPRTVLVTGGGSGIGAAAVRLFLEQGDRVFAGDLDPSGVPDGAHPVQLDVSEPESVTAFVEQALDATGRVDVLCNNAGIGSTTDAVGSSLEEWDRVFAVNARGVFLCTQQVLPSMLDRGAGVIVNTASVAGLVGLKDRAAYCASKGAVIAFTRQVAVQYAGTGVRCSCVCPGTIDSPWVGRLLDQADDPEQARAALTARQPVGRLGRPEEVAQAIGYLASDAAEFATGTVLVLDGGLTAA